MSDMTVLLGVTPGSTPAITPLRTELLLAADKHSAKVTDWGGRLLWIAICLLFVLGVYLLMWRAWKRRIRRQSDLPQLPPVPDDLGTPLLAPLTGRYFGSTASGRWLDRIVAQGLGTRSPARLTLTARGLMVDRPGATAFFVPADRITDARLDQAHAGKVLPEGGLLVVSWRLGDTPDAPVLDSGFRGEHQADHDLWLETLSGLAAGASPAAGTSLAAGASTVTVGNDQEGTVQ